MKKILFLLFSMIALSGWSQDTYSSSYTQFWPTIFTTEIEQINRSISFDENSISLFTENNGGKVIEIFYIRKIDEKEDAIFYSCLSSDEQQVLFVKPITVLRFIDIYRPSSKTGEEVQLRIHLD